MSQESRDVNDNKPVEGVITGENADKTTNQQTRASYETVNRIMKKVVKCEKAWKDWFKINQTSEKESTPFQDEHCADLEGASGSASESNVAKIKTDEDDEPRNITSIISPYMKINMQVKPNACSDCTQTVCVPKHDLNLKSSVDTSSTGKYSLPTSTLCATEELKLEKFSDECCSCSEKDTDDEYSERSCNCCSCNSSKLEQYNTLHFNKTSQHLTDVSSMSSEDSTQSCVINSLLKVSKSTNGIPNNVEYFKQKLRIKTDQEHAKSYITGQKSDNNTSVDKPVLRHVEKCELEMSEEDLPQIQLKNAEHISEETNSLIKMLNSLEELKVDSTEQPRILKDQILEVTSVLKSDNHTPNDYTTNLFESCDDSFDNFLHNIKQMCALLTCEIDFMEEASKNLATDSETKRFLLDEYVNNTQNIITSFCRRWSIQ